MYMECDICGWLLPEECLTEKENVCFVNEKKKSLLCNECSAMVDDYVNRRARFLQNLQGGVNE